MQIQGSSSAEVSVLIGEYIDKGWHQVSLAANSGNIPEIVKEIETSKAFDHVFKSEEVGINAQKMTDADEFVLTLIFNPASKEAINLMKLTLTRLIGKDR